MKPEQALHNWNVPNLKNLDPTAIKRAASGLLNQTYLIRVNKPQPELYILQCVHPAVSMDGAMNNYFHVTQFLQSQNQPTQIMFKTIEDKLWVEDDELKTWRWRLMRGVEGEFYDKTTDTTLAKEAGKLLGQFHRTLSKYPRELEVGRISFQYDQELAKLHQFKDQLMADPDEFIHRATQLLLAEFPDLMLPTDLPKRIIHGDPKISNVLFTPEKQGICFIDLDTIQFLSPLYDLGDAMRSWCGQDEDDPNNTFNPEMYNALLSGYLSTSKDLLTEREIALIPKASKLIMLGLTARFLNDYIEDSYFGYDETRYESRKAHNKARVMGQLSLYQSAINSI